MADFITAEQIRVLSERPELPIGGSAQVDLINPSAEMQWPTSLASSYEKNRDKILENIAYRYKTLPAVIGPTLAALLANAEFTRTAKRLQSEGWLDWHLLIA